jgi:hypothetical protein
MPERVTKEERMVTLAIEKARKTIETLRESTQVIPVDTEVEVQKIKRPKVQDASKITNQTQDKEGYGLAGESLKKAKFQGPPRKNIGSKYQDTVLTIKLKDTVQNINSILKGSESINNIDALKRIIKRAQKELDKIDEVLLDAAKYGKGNPRTVTDRTDSKNLSIAGAKYDKNRSFE